MTNTITNAMTAETVKNNVLSAAETLNANIGQFNRPVLPVYSLTDSQIAVLKKCIDFQKYKTADEFRKDYENGNWKRLLKKALTALHGKLEEVTAFSTSALFNGYCIKRSQDEKSICFWCYARKQLMDANFKQNAALSLKLIRNTLLFNSVLIPVEYFPVIKSNYFRFESHGDLLTMVQFENYLNLCIKPENKNVHFAIWTKNPEIMKEVFKYRKKPENLKIVYSNAAVNTVLDYVKIVSVYPFVDMVFNVLDEKTAAEKNITFNCHCGKAACAKKCGICYEKNNIHSVYEKLRS